MTYGVREECEDETCPLNRNGRCFAKNGSNVPCTDGPCTWNRGLDATSIAWKRPEVL